MNTESDIIRTIQKFAPEVNPSLALPIGDDASFLKLAQIKKKYLLVSTDQLVEGVHFRWDWCSPGDAAYKLLQMNLSDMIVKGGKPSFALLNLQLSSRFVDDPKRILEFAKVLGHELKKYHVQLIGGDTTSSQVDSFGLTLLGEGDQFISRRSMHLQADNGIVLVGQVGGGSLALARLLDQNKKRGDIQPEIKAYYTRPAAQWEGRELISRLEAKASIDTSDGLHEGLKVLSKNNSLCLEIWVDQIPCIPELDKMELSQKLKHLLGGGEDFAMLLMVPAGIKKSVDTLSKNHTYLKVIGRISSVGPPGGIKYFYKGKELDILASEIHSFSHF